MKICPQCNIEYQDNMKFCPECGSKLDSKVVLNPDYGSDFSYIEYRFESGIDDIESNGKKQTPTFFRIDSIIEDDDLNKSIEDEFGVKYSRDGSRLLVGSDVDDYQVRDCVMVICKNAFSKCKRLKSVSLPSTVTLIGDSAFEGCESLCEITLPNSVVSIGKHSFEGTSIKSITLSQTLIYIGESAFSGCPIERINIPNSVKRIGKFAFDGCDVLKYVVLPQSLDMVDEAVFRDCRELEYITMPDTIKVIKTNAFYGCSGLSSVKFSKALTLIEDSAFYGCTSLKKISLPIYLRNIGDSAFERCDALSYIRFNSSTTIRGRSFWGCLSIRSLIVPNGAKDNFYNIFVGNSANLNNVICECNDSSEICDDVCFAFATQYEVVKPLFRNWFVVGITNKSKKGHWYDEYFEGIVDSHNNIVIPIQYWKIFTYNNMLIATGRNALVMDLNANKLIDSDDLFIEKMKDGLIIKQGNRNQILRYEQFYAVSPNFFEAEKLNDYLFKLYGCDNYDFDNYWQDRTYFRIIDKLNRDVLGKNYNVIDEINGIYFLLSDICQSREYGYDIAMEKNGHILINEDMSLKLFPTKDGYIIFRNDYEYGLFDASFRTIIPPKYDSLEFVEPGILKTGRQLINYKEERLVKSNGAYIAFSPKFDWVWKITEDLYTARKNKDDGNEDENNIGLIDKKEQTILPFEYESISKFRLNDKLFIKIYQNSKTGLVAMDGKTLLIAIKYNHIDSFYLDRQVIHPYTTVWNQKGLDRLYGVIDEDFVEILPPVHQIIRFPSEGIITLMTNNLWGMFHINENKTQLIYDCTCLGNFAEGLCSINKGGKIRISKEYDERYEDDFYIDPNYNVYLNAEGGKWGFINVKGEIVIPVEYDSVKRFQEGLAPVCIGDKWGFVDNKGVLVVEPKYKYVSGFNKGTATCYLEYESYGDYEIIDRKGIIIEKGYERENKYDSYGSENWYTQEELNDMYREAFDDNPDNYWGND